MAAAIFGGLVVALGAFGAHGLEGITKDEKILHGFQTGVQYQMYHALALLFIALLYDKLPGKWLKWAGNSFIAGIFLFRDPYIFLLFKNTGKQFGKVSGTGNSIRGLFFIAGWLFLLVAAFKNNN